MVDVIFYSTGEIFWVNDPPFCSPHVGIPNTFAAVPSDDLFTYSMAAHCLETAGHNVIGAYGRVREAVRASGGPDPEFLRLADVESPQTTVVVLIATDKSPQGSDRYRRVPFHRSERDALDLFISRGGGLYVTWDHGPLGLESLAELGLDGPVLPEPAQPLRPNFSHANDSTDSHTVIVDGAKILSTQPDGSQTTEPAAVPLASGPPAGYLQKIIPAQHVHKRKPGEPPVVPHPIFNGVGGADGIWIPAHMHEGILRGRATLKGIDETALPSGVRFLALHVPITETSTQSFAVMAYRDSKWTMRDGLPVLERGRVLWDTSFHHLVDINWSSNGKVPWANYVTFSPEMLWKQQFSEALFEERLSKGMKRLLVNAVKWLAHEIARPTMSEIAMAAGLTTRGHDTKRSVDADAAPPQNAGVASAWEADDGRENNYPGDGFFDF